MNDTDLDELVKTLQAQFKDAVARQPLYEDQKYADASTPSNFAIANRQAIGQLGAALIEGVKEQRLRASEGGLFKLDKKG